MQSQDPIIRSIEVGSLGVCHLKRVWSRAMRSAQGLPLAQEDAGEWIIDKMVLDGLGLALEETMQFLFQRGPTWDTFESWVLEKNGGCLDPRAVRRINAVIRGTGYDEDLANALAQVEQSPPVLTAEDLAFWKEQGYVVVHDAISPEQCQATEQAVWQFLGADPQDPDTWYRPHTHGIMVQFFHHPALAANRRSPRIHKAFAQLWGTADLWVTCDRVSCNPPERAGWKFPGPRLHWDTSLVLPIPFGVQGLLYLTDTPANQGAFTCVPGFHRRIAAWLQSLPPGADPQMQDLESLGAAPSGQSRRPGHLAPGVAPRQQAEPCRPAAPGSVPDDVRGAAKLRHSPAALPPSPLYSGERGRG